MLAREVWRFARFSAPEWGEALHYTLVDSAAAGGVRDGVLVGGEEHIEAHSGETSLAPTPIPAASAISSASPARAGGLCGGTPPGATSVASPTLFEVRRAKLASDLAHIGVPAGRTRWIGSLGELARSHESSSMDEMRNDQASAPHRVTGVILSNELIDALPAHVVQIVSDDTPHLAEVYVDLDAHGRFVERLDAPSSPHVAEYLDRFDIPWRAYGAGWRAEAPLAAEQWMREAADALGKGFLLTIDYGASARRLNTRDRRHGTLAVYSRHQFGGQPLAAPGQQDITAHVNFSALARAGCEQGYRGPRATRRRAAFLRRLGVVEAARMLGQRFYPAADSERQSDHWAGRCSLRRRMLESNGGDAGLDLRGLGGFRVLVQQRGVPNAGHLLTENGQNFRFFFGDEWPLAIPHAMMRFTPMKLSALALGHHGVYRRGAPPLDAPGFQLGEKSRAFAADDASLDGAFRGTSRPRRRHLASI